MLERLGRLCVGVGLLWVLSLVSMALMVGFDKPELLAPYADSMIGPSVRELLYMGLTFVVVPVGMGMILRDMIGDPEPLWLKLAAPGAFAAVYAFFLAAAVPTVGQPILLVVDPFVRQVLPTLPLTKDPNDALAWLARFGALFAGLAGIPGAVGLLLGLLTGGSRSR